MSKLKGEPWEKFRDRYGDGGRDLALYLGRQHCGLKLRELAVEAGGIDYGSLSNAVARFARRMQKDAKLSAIAQKANAKLMNDET